MTSKTIFTAVALATLSFLTACGGGDASGDNVANQAQASGVGGIGGSGVTGQGVGGIGGSGLTTQGVGGIGGSGIVAQGVGGIGGSGVTAQGVGGSGITAQGVGGIGGSGIQSVARTQACGLKSVNVTVAGARLNTNGAADLGSEGWVDVALAAPVRVDLLALAAGAALPLDLSALPAGTYGQMRLLLVVDDAASPLADSVVGASGVETALAVPGTAQGGLPLAVKIAVAGGQVSASTTSLAVCEAVTGTAGSYAIAAVDSVSTQVALAN